MRVKREMILEKLQEELQTKENELNRIRIALDESNYHRKQKEDIVPTKNSLNNRVKSAPNFGGVHRKVKIKKSSIYIKYIS